MTQTQDFCYKWLENPEEYLELTTQKEVAIFLGVSEELVSQSCKKWKKEQVQDNHDLPEYLRHLKELAYDPKAPVKNRELYAKILGWLQEKKETNKEEISAEEYISIGTRVIKQLQDEYRQGNRSCPVCGRPQEICDEPHLDTEPERPEDREVAGVAVPSRPD